MRLPTYVYAIKNEATGKSYVGRSSRLKERIQRHMRELRNGTHPVTDMQTDFDEHGNHLRVIILDRIDTYEDRGKELLWQKQLNTLDRRYGYNYRDPAVVRYGRKKSNHT